VRSYLNLGLVVAAVAAIAFLSTASISAPSGSSYIGHLLMYFGLATIFLLYFHYRKHDHIDAVALAGLTGLMFEFMQSGISYRTFSLLDAGANFLGASLVLADRRLPFIHRIISFEEQLIQKIT